jgi:hypothetical protein
MTLDRLPLRAADQDLDRCRATGPAGVSSLLDLLGEAALDAVASFNGCGVCRD